MTRPCVQINQGQQLTRRELKEPNTPQGCLTSQTPGSLSTFPVCHLPPPHPTITRTARRLVSGVRAAVVAAEKQLSPSTYLIAVPMLLVDDNWLPFSNDTGI